jgi:hypothetical protein
VRALRGIGRSGWRFRLSFREPAGSGFCLALPTLVPRTSRKRRKPTRTAAGYSSDAPTGRRAAGVSVGAITRESRSERAPGPLVFGWCKPEAHSLRCSPLSAGAATFHSGLLHTPPSHRARTAIYSCTSRDASFPSGQGEPVAALAAPRKLSCGNGRVSMCAAVNAGISLMGSRQQSQQTGNGR